MGAEGAVNILNRKEIESAKDEETRARLVKEYSDKFVNPIIAAQRGIIDGIIQPRQTRTELIRALSVLRDKSELRPQRKHGNIPL
jgi:propionyl-CoA carboxylase beta chain